MNSPHNQIDPGHQAMRSLLRTLGPLMLVVGLILLAIGVSQMFSPDWAAKPDGFVLAATGMFCAAAGVAMIKFGYMGAVARYAAEELTPVGADAVNYLGENTREGVRDFTEAISEGIRNTAPGESAPEHNPKRCPDCQALNAAGAKFCNQCGRALAQV